jgi:hypothetical protein
MANILICKFPKVHRRGWRIIKSIENIYGVRTNWAGKIETFESDDSDSDSEGSSDADSDSDGSSNTDADSDPWPWRGGGLAGKDPCTQS